MWTREQRHEFRREVDEAGVIRGREYQVYRQDGSKFWVAVNARAVRDETGAISYYEGFIQDITDTEARQGALMTDLFCHGQDLAKHPPHQAIISSDIKGFRKSPHIKVNFAIQIISGIFPGKEIIVEHGSDC